MSHGVYNFVPPPATLNLKYIHPCVVIDQENLVTMTQTQGHIAPAENLDQTWDIGHAQGIPDPGEFQLDYDEWGNLVMKEDAVTGMYILQVTGAHLFP